MANIVLFLPRHYIDRLRRKDVDLATDMIFRGSGGESFFTILPSLETFSLELIKIFYSIYLKNKHMSGGDIELYEYEVIVFFLL